MSNPRETPEAPEMPAPDRMGDLAGFPFAEFAEFRAAPPSPPAANPPAAPQSFDHDAALRKYLMLLDDAIEWCCSHDRYDRNVSTAVAARLIKTSLVVGTALKDTPERRFTHRIVVEHLTHPAEENLKTIPGACAEVQPQD